MLKGALDAFIASDADAACKIAGKDDIVDKLRDQVNRELLTYILEDSRSINQINSFMFITRWLERYADHVTNICEWIIYDATGKHVELNS